MKTVKETVLIAAVGDLHYTKSSQGALQKVFSRITESADVLLLCGDITDTGLPEEARVLAKDVTSYIKIPVIAVLGNHDLESGKSTEVHDIFQNAGITILDGTACEFNGVGFAGVKGFAGGFMQRMLQPWGEEAIKHFVQVSIDETLKLESALAKLSTDQRIVLLHYSPVRDTVEGENLEIFPFLGSSRMEEPLNHYQVTAAFHGHAHSGSPEGRTKGNIPVYNVAMPLLHRTFPDQPPFRLLEVPVGHKVSNTSPGLCPSVL
ncbi:MAG: metallophosphoesterase family protein [Nitrospirota bacterium]